MTTDAGVALIGYGLAGSAFHAPFIAATAGLRLAAVVTGDAGRAAEVRQRYPDTEVIGSVDELWRRAGEYDLAVVASPNRHHHDQATAALTAGLSVVVDKPAAATGAQVRDLAATAARVGRVFTTFQNRRWDGDFRTVRRLLDDGDLAGVTRFESRFERAAAPVKSGWKGSADPADLADIRYDLGSHLIDQAVVLFGRPRTVFAEVQATRAGAPSPEDATILLTHAGGVRSYLRVSKASAPVGPRFAVAGPDVGYHCWGLDPQEAASRSGRLPTEPGFGAYPESQWGEVVTASGSRRVPTLDGDYLGFYAALAACLRGAGPNPVPPEETADVADTIDAAFRSAELGVPVDVT
ncbi:Gfo/Idh/MocA family oxidoreductase [Actinokineospora globicatena]|uniref:Gfo/Idh/MocA family oxidoreductase n=1 Tax=Actinokineospora globicatena TaxID=103729 RepID=UPI0020A3C2DD|nr:Gfo/Idh/MocA family oxidoreductase [Actinokineospora globicatena]MCP2304718.1 putative dehydrogenase [Actinokineospora globicatena]GLW77906.1 oxidoreductase [Actinokineospora globicatena]GLW85427.1 oxidoreductase [Actinokineospora globicatena]